LDRSEEQARGPRLNVNQWSTSVFSRMVVPYRDWDSLARHLEVPALVVAPIEPPSVVKQVSWPQEIVTDTFPDTALDVTRAPMGALVLLATSFVILLNY